MLLKIFTSMTLTCLGFESYQQAQKFTKNANNTEYNQEFVAASMGTLKWLLIGLALGRILLVVAAYKDDRLLKAFFYYEVLIEITSQFIPKTAFANHDSVAMIWMLTTAANFTLMYCDFKLSLCACLFSLLTFQVGTYIVFD